MNKILTDPFGTEIDIGDRGYHVGGSRYLYIERIRVTRISGTRVYFQEVESWDQQVDPGKKDSFTSTNRLIILEDDKK